VSEGEISELFKRNDNKTMNNNKKNGLSHVSLLIIIFLGLLIIIPVFIVLFFRFESEPPTFHITPTPDTIGADTTLSITVKDQKSGIKRVWIAILKDQKETLLFDETLSTAFFKGSGIHEKEVLVTIKPHELGLSDGVANLRIAVWDCAIKGIFKGNRTYTEQKVNIDTRPPSIEVLSRSHNMHQGGAGLVVYRVSEQALESGVRVGDRFFPGYPGHFSDKSIYMAFFAIPYDQGGNTDLFLTALDYGKNRSKAGFQYYINKKKFKSDTIRLSDNFLGWKMPEFETTEVKQGASLKEKFLYVNRTVRQKSSETLVKACSNSTPQILWNARFLRLPRSAQKAGFADLRTYVYKDKIIDKQTHLGIDLASTAHSPIPASNHGKVVLADDVGIYGKTVIIDHGLGLFSIYSHLSRSTVTPGQEVKKGEIIGNTGTTGMAGGDHLHFGVLIHDTFVNPLEWWDATWIKHNITDKIRMVTKGENQR
jgi:murein DD-endopeptidase MepM/ murein hydrolase activator NlpD